MSSVQIIKELGGPCSEALRCWSAAISSSSSSSSSSPVAICFLSPTPLLLPLLALRRWRTDSLPSLADRRLFLLARSLGGVEAMLSPTASIGRLDDVCRTLHDRDQLLSPVRRINQSRSFSRTPPNYTCAVLTFTELPIAESLNLPRVSRLMTN